MDFYQILAVFTCLISTVTFVLVAVAVVPHVKHGLAVIRDAVLWATLVVVLALVIWRAWDRFSPQFLGPTASSAVVQESAPSVGQARPFSHSDSPAGDRYYRPVETP
jgi:hypothetical protein